MTHRTRLEVWAGVECARVRIGDGHVDELDLTGHAWRDGDVDLLRSLGVRRVRYPVLWERTEGEAPGLRDWRWSDGRMARLAALGVEPIVGLLHHGAGPAWTSFLDPAFPDQFGNYARAVAERYPHVEWYVPINEPLTTARFAGLYGFWWPHQRDWDVFARIIVAECLATRAAIEAIRTVNPRARFVQNEDLGRTDSTPEVAAQAEADNERRWLTFDLLTGRVVRGHRFWRLLVDAGLGAEVGSLAQRPCPPDLLGVDYYVTSDRFLDHRIDRYPAWTLAGDEGSRYADVEAVRSSATWTCGFGRAIDEAWSRYRIPIALTEVQLAAQPDDQCAWWAEAVRLAQTARRKGADVRAVTAWSVFGAWEWPSLLLRQDGAYEAGAFDAREEKPRETPLAEAVRRTARGTRGRSAVPATGWWARPDRVLYAAGD
jgi:dTDP-4-dehydrorhamnose reductase